MITVECPKCSTAMEVPATAAGARGKCTKCGGTFQVPSRTQKVCKGCKVDVSAAKRVKDDQGQYYCENCYQKKTDDAQSRNAEIEKISAEFNQVKRARRIGNTIVLFVWTPVVLALVVKSVLAGAMNNPGFIIGYLAALLISYVIPLVIMSLAWPSYRRNPVPLAKQLQTLLDS